MHDHDAPPAAVSPPDEDKAVLVRTLIAQTGREGARQVLLRYYIGGEERQALADELGLPLRRVHHMLRLARSRYQALLEGRRPGERPGRRRGTARDDDHEEIDELALVERYPRHDLSAEERDRFEAHFAACPRCRSALEAAGDLQRLLRRVAADDAAEVAMARAGVATWMARRGRHLGTALAVLVLVVVAAGTIWYGSRLRHQQEELAAARAATEEQRQLVEAERRESARLAAELEERGRLWGRERDALLDRLATPRTVIDPARLDDAWTLAVDLGGGPDFASYRLTVLGPGGAVEHRREGLRAGAAELLLVTFAADLLPAGDHRLLVEGIGAGGTATEVAVVPFRITGES